MSRREGKGREGKGRIVNGSGVRARLAGRQAGWRMSQEIPEVYIALCSWCGVPC